VGRSMPVECEHGVVVDWGDFGPRHDDSQQGLVPCEKCEADEYRIAVRPHHEHEDWCDDIAVNDVSMFRLEQMAPRIWWACCYLAGEDDGNRISFDIRYVPKEREVVVTVTEWPTGVRYEATPGAVPAGGEEPTDG
jgi:hypothetical protein